jgi:hypothetical protein
MQLRSTRDGLGCLSLSRLLQRARNRCHSGFSVVALQRQQMLMHATELKLPARETGLQGSAVQAIREVTISITLSEDLVQAIDRAGADRSRFLTEAVRAKLREQA